MTKTELQAMAVPELEKLRGQIDNELTRRRNQSGLKEGDEVKHRRGGFAGKGKVIEIAKSGLRAKVELKSHWGTSKTYFKVELLEKV